MEQRGQFPALSESAVGQNRKSSMRAYVFRYAPESGHRAMQSAGPFRANSCHYPTAYTSAVAIPLPSEQVVQQIMGKSYDPARTLNVLKMFAGTDDLYEATIGIVHAMFQAKGIDPRTREMIILRAAKVLNAPYEAQANVQMAKNAGLSPAEIERCRHRRSGIWN